MNRGVILIVVDLDKDPNAIRVITDQIDVPPHLGRPLVLAAQGKAAEVRIAGYLGTSKLADDREAAVS